MQRGAVSIMSNIAEGFERGTRGEFRQFLSIAKGSCAEVRSQLYVAFDVGYLNEGRFQDLLASTEEVSRIIRYLHASISRPRNKP